jgi:undecaprenyl-diphosphatase
MLEKLIHFDKWLFTKINQTESNSFFDFLLPIVRQPLTWIPLYLFLIVFAILNFPQKALSWIMGLVVTVTITDSISSHIIKPAIGRLRPCNDPKLVDHIRLLIDHCGQNGSFTSSHATNHFGIAAFLFFTLKNIWGNYTALFFLWAALISYAQVYVGVHFPFDVIGGMILGILIGWMTSKVYIKKFGQIIYNDKKQ